MRNENSEMMGTAGRWMRRSFGIYLFGGSLLCGVLSLVALRLFVPLVEKAPNPEQIPPHVLWCIEHSLAIPLTAIPALFLGVMLMKSKRRTVVLVLLGTALMFLPLALTLYCFIRLIAPLYTVQPL